MSDKKYEFTGTILSIAPVQQITDKFRKQDVVISDKSADYPQTILFEFHNDNCDHLVNYKEGSLVNVSFNLKGRQYDDNKGGKKTFNTLAVWKISAVSISK